MAGAQYDQLMAAAAAALRAQDWAEAERLHLLAAAMRPDDPAPHHWLGEVLRKTGRLEAAEVAYRRALELAPQSHGTRRMLALAVLGQGRLAEGFALYEARHALPAMAKPPLPFPEWRGEAVAGKRLLIWPEHGLGDQIMFARFARALRDLGADVTLLAPPPLARLFEASLGVRVVAAEGRVEFPDPDAWVMACALAWRLGVTADAIPGEPYLAAPGGAGRPTGLRIGLATRGDPQHQNDANRSLPPEAAARLRDLPAEVVSLAPADTGARDFADTAALVDGLDLVISVDTAVAHLAGAMGKPCWTLLPAVETDWRWFRGRSDTPWYPTMRLYRQESPGDWTAVIDRVEADLAGLGA